MTLCLLRHATKLLSLSLPIFNGIVMICKEASGSVISSFLAKEYPLGCAIKSRSVTQAIAQETPATGPKLAKV